MYSVEEAAGLVGLTWHGLMLHVKNGNLPTRKFGRQYLIVSDDLDRFVAARQAGRFIQGWNLRKEGKE
jgi:excisionase family DNA binding protein